MAGPTIPLEDRFWSKVTKTETCWLWQAQVNNKGYGRFHYFSRRTNASPGLYAHRVAWMLTNGDIPDGLDVLHRCDNPPCVKPSHLFLGTHLENMADARHKQRFPHGQTHHFAKLDEDSVRAIRSDTRSQYTIAADYGVNQDVVSRIKSRKIWKHVA